MLARRPFLACCRTVCLGAIAASVTPRALAQSRSSGGSIASAGAAVPAKAYAEFQTFIRTTRSAQGRFRQQVLHSSGRVIETTEGNFAFSRPGRFRWEVKKPYEQLLVADGERLYFFDRDLNQVTIRKLGDAIASTPAAILFGNESIERDFVFTEAGLHEGLLWLEAAPRNRDSGVERMAIGLRGGFPEAMHVVDAFGRTSRFTFEAVERNSAIDATLFGFRVPAGADVIRQ